MCVTEVWTYRDCGCHYNQSILCRSYRRDRSPCLAPNVDFSVDKWLRETGVDAEKAYKQFQWQIKPAEPQDCPQHGFVQRTFLNPICEDCLLAEVKVDPLDPGLAGNASHEATPPHADHGLVWDSEVKVEIQDQKALPPLSRTTSNSIANSKDSSHADAHHRIFDSHVEVKVEVDGYSTSAGPSSSPICPPSSGSPKSRSSSIITSPSSTYSEDEPDVVSPAPRNKRYGLAFHDTVIPGFDDADDEYHEDSETELLPSSPPQRGRTLTRSSDGDAQRRSVDSTRSTSSNVDRDGGRRRKRSNALEGIGSLPPAVPSKDAPKTNPPSDLQPPPIADARPRTLFQSLRGRKSSPLLMASIENDDHLSISRSRGERRVATHAGTEGRSTSGSHKTRLKSWAFLKFQDLKRNKHELGSRSRSRARSRAPSPTASWTRNHHELYTEEIAPPMPSPVSRAEIPFVFGTAVSTPEGTETKATKGSSNDTGASSFPKTSSMHMVQAVLDGFRALELGFEQSHEPESPHEDEKRFSNALDSAPLIEEVQHDNTPRPEPTQGRPPPEPVLGDKSSNLTVYTSRQEAASHDQLIDSKLMGCLPRTKSLKSPEGWQTSTGGRSECSPEEEPVKEAVSVL